MTSPTSEQGHDIVVGFADEASSLVALKRAIAEVRVDDTARLVVVHASSSPIKVRNGPSAAVARAIGEPAWATVHTTVLDAGAVADRAMTVIEPGDPVSVLARHCVDASVVYLGPTHRRVLRRRSMGRLLGAVVDCPVVQVAEGPTRSRVRAQAVRSNHARTLQPGMYS